MYEWSKYFDPQVWMVLKALIYPIAIDIGLGVIVAIKNGDFSFRWLPQFLQTQVLPYMGGLMVLGAFSHEPSAKALFMAAAAALATKYAADWKQKFSDIFGGVEE